MDRTKDHHDNPELLLREWKDPITNKFYLICVDLKSNKLRVVHTNEGNRIFKTKGFHPTVVDSKIIMPFETDFSKLMSSLVGQEPNTAVRLQSDMSLIINFSARQLIGGQKFKNIAKEQYKSFPDLLWINLIDKYPDVPVEELLLSYYSEYPTYRKQLRYEDTMFQKYDENVRKLSSMKCWGVCIDPDIAEFITGGNPWFSELRGDDFEQMNCVRRIYLAINPSFCIVFTDTGCDLVDKEAYRFNRGEALAEVRYFNTEIQKKSDYIITRSLPFVGYEFFPSIKKEIEAYLASHTI